MFRPDIRKIIGHVAIELIQSAGYVRGEVKYRMYPLFRGQCKCERCGIIDGKRKMWSPSGSLVCESCSNG